MSVQYALLNHLNPWIKTTIRNPSEFCSHYPMFPLNETITVEIRAIWNEYNWYFRQTLAMQHKQVPPRKCSNLYILKCSITDKLIMSPMMGGNRMKLTVYLNTLDQMVISRSRFHWRSFAPQWMIANPRSPCKRLQKKGQSILVN